MHPAARIFLGIVALWTLLKIPLLFTVAEETRRHLGEAPTEIRRTLRNRMISTYGVGFLNIIILALTAAIAIRGSTSFIEAWGPVLIPAFVVAAGISLFGLKAHFDSLHNPQVDEFYRRYGIRVQRLSAEVAAPSDRPILILRPEADLPSEVAAERSED